MGDDDLWVMMTYEDHMMRQVSQVGSSQVMSGQVGPGRVRSVRSGQVVSGLVRSGQVHSSIVADKTSNLWLKRMAYVC